MSRARLWQRWRRWLAVLGIFALGIPASAALMVRSSTSRERLHDLATNVIRDELGLRATIGRVQLQLVPFALKARDITLDDPVYGRFATAEELSIEPSFRALLRGGIDIDTIRIRRADLRLVVRNGQVRNLPRAEGPPPSGAGPPTLPFDAFYVIDSTLTVDAEPHASGQLRHVDLEVTGIEGGIAIEADSRDGWVRHRGGRDTISLIDARAEITEHEIRLPHVELETPHLDVAVRTAVLPIPFEDHGYSGHVELSYDLGQLERLPLPEDVTLPPIQGRVALNARFFTRDDVQHAQGMVELRDSFIEQFGIGETAHIEFLANRDRVALRDGSWVTVPRGGGRVNLAGGLQLDPERGFPLDVRADVDDVSFARVMLDLGVTENGIVEWTLDGSLVLRGTLDPLRLEGPVHLRTRDFRVTHDPWHAEHVRRVIGVSHGTFDGRWTIREDAVRFHDLVGVLPRSRIRGDVHLGFDNQLRVNARADVDLRDITPLDRWAILGVGTATCTIDGTFQDPHVTGHVDLDDFVFDTFRLGDVESDALLDPDGMGVHFAMVSAVKNESRYRAENLYLNFHENRFEMTGLMHLDGLALADFYHVFGFEEDERFAPYQGTARGQADVRYTNGFPDDSPSGTLDVDLNLDFPTATLNDYAFEDGRLVGRWRWLDWDRGAAGAELSIAHLSLHKGEGTLSVSGDMRLGGRLAMDAVADRVMLSQLEGIGDRFDGLDGVATAIGQIGGTFDAMRADFDVGVTNVTYDGRPLGDGRFFVRLTDTSDPWVVEAGDWDRRELPEAPCARARVGLAHADWPADPPMRTIEGLMPRLERPSAFLICGSGLDDHLFVDLAVGRTEPLPLRGVVRLDGFDFGALLPRSEGAMPFEGAVSGELAFDDGAMRQLETLEGSVRLTDVRLARADLEIRNRRDVDLVFKDGVLAINKARFVGPDSRLRVRGRASVEDGLALQVNGDVDLGLLTRLSPSVEEATGRVEARFNVTGQLGDPELYGEATLEGGRFRLASFDEPIEQVGGRVRFSQRSILLEELHADVAGGHVSASGAAELREQSLERYVVDVAARDLGFDFAEGVDTNLGGEMQLSWSRGERLPTLRGDLTVSRFEYTRPIELRSLGDVAATAVRGLMRQERTAVRRYDPEADLVALDLRVVQRRPFRIQNNLIDADVRLDTRDRPFRLVGTDQRYGVQGAMRITRGQLYFQNNEFTVRRGRITFDDSTRIDPRLDIEATTEIRRSSDLSAPSWRIVLNLLGSSDNLQLVTRSDPDLPQPDILLLLAVGMTRAELQQLQQEGDLASAAALEALTTITGLDREVRRAVPLIDDIRVTTGYSPQTGRSEPRLSVGKRIAERVRLSAQTGLGESREFRGALDWQLDDNQRIGLSYDNYNINGTNSFGNLGVDWGYRLEFE